MSRTLTQRPSDLTGLGNRFLAILLMKAGLGLSPIKTAQALTRGAFGLVLVVERKTSRAKVAREKALGVLESGLEFQAKLDVEQVIRQELEIKAYDTLRRRCNQLADRLGAVSSQRECPEDVKEAMCTIIWAAGQGEVPAELAVVRAQLSMKYGNKLVLRARSNESGCVDRLVSSWLLFQADPSPFLVEDYLATMAGEIEARRRLSASSCSPDSFYSRIKPRRPLTYHAPPPPKLPTSPSARPMTEEEKAPSAAAASLVRRRGARGGGGGIGPLAVSPTVMPSKEAGEAAAAEGPSAGGWFSTASSSSSSSAAAAAAAAWRKPTASKPSLVCSDAAALFLSGSLSGSLSTPPLSSCSSSATARSSGSSGSLDDGNKKGFQRYRLAVPYKAETDTFVHSGAGPAA